MAKARQLKPAEQAEQHKQQDSPQTQLREPGPQSLAAEHHYSIPEFDLQDLPALESYW
ncbi:hypothetical protein ACIPLR_20915 [Herbaspirillum huttiense]|uniref:hypothetical protein n=1 Tax=Herbaspirillum huttiense TaxID=863372 RepID=UPI0037FC72F7